MTDLISRKDLLEAIKTFDEKYELQKVDVYDLINTAPTVEGEPVGWTNEMQLSFLNDGDACLVYPDTAECPIPLYTTPLQSQTVKEALEKAASICDEMVLYTGLDCAQEIRELIEE